MADAEDEQHETGAGEDSRSAADIEAGGGNRDDGEEQAELRRIPAHPPTPQGYATQAPQRYILMTPHMVAIGGMLAFFTVVLMVVVLPVATYNPPASDNWLPLSDQQMRGRANFIANGCTYCHSGFTRPQDVFNSSYYLYPRVSEPGDYFGIDQSPNLMGSERTGPDLSQEGGTHPDMWHVAHYWNPRSTTPLSIMPRFDFFTPQELTDTIAFNQASGGKDAVLRYAAMTVAQHLASVSGGKYTPEQMFPNLVKESRAKGEYVEKGKSGDLSPSGLAWGTIYDLNTFERSYWLTRDPLEPTAQNLNRGRAVFATRCISCHGMTGLGDGPAATFLDPKPDNFSHQDMFTSPTDSDGERYHRILTGGRGSAMEDFGTRLSVDDVWRLVLFLRTIPNGGFQQPVTTVDKYEAWTAPPALMSYIQTHPLNAPGLPPLTGGQPDPFMGAAQWIVSGMAPKDTILLGGQLPMSLERVAGLVRAAYFDMVGKAYNDAVQRREELPSKDNLMSLKGVEFHAP